MSSDPTSEAKTPGLEYKECSQDELDKVIWGYVVVVLSVIGMLLSLLSLPTLLSKQLHQSCYTYLSALAMSDLIGLLVFGINGIGRGHFLMDWGGTFETKVYMTLGSACGTLSSFLIVTVTFERYLLIYFPAKAKKLCRPRTARKVVTGLSVFSAMIGSSKLNMYDFDSDLCSVVGNELRKSDYGVFLLWGHLILSLGLTICLIVVTSLIIHRINNTLHRKDTGRVEGERNRQSRERITRILLIIAISYVTVEFPTLIISRIGLGPLINEMMHGRFFKSSLYKILVSVCTILTMFHFGANFVVYSLMNNKFRAIFRRKMCGKKWRKRRWRKRTQVHISMKNDSSEHPQEPRKVLEHIWITKASLTVLDKGNRAHTV